MTRRLDLPIAAAILAACATLYLVTLAPGLPHPPGDSHELTTAAATLGLAHRTGYPLFTWLGWLFVTLLPVGEIAYRTNAMCALLAAAGVAGLYLLARQLGLRPLIAAFTALLYGSTTTFWSQAVLTEVYAVNVFVLTIQLNLLVAWSRLRRTGLLVAFAFVFGLSPGTHMSNLGMAPGWALFILLTDWRIVTRPRTILAMLAVFLLGLAQFAWLPLRAHTARFPNPTPDTVQGLWDYTLGAFAGSRFAFPLSELPARFAIHVRFLAENFTPAGIAAALLGMWALLARDPVRFWLVMAVYATSVVVFTQLAVFDLDVFFLSGYVAFALFVGFGVDAAGAALRPLLGGVPAVARAAAGALVLAAAVGAVTRGSFAANDRRGDTAVADFQHALFATLPPDSVVVAPSGVFAQALAYYHDLLGLRPDVLLVNTPDARPARPAAARYTTLGILRGELTPSSRWGLSPHALPAGAWFVPVLLGARHDLVLWRVDTTPPVFAPPDAVPAVRRAHRFAGATLEGVTVTPLGPGRVHLQTHWETAASVVVVGTRIGGQRIESHELGFGNRERWTARVGAPGTRLVESFALVVPSTLPRGRHALEVGVTRFEATGFATEWLEVGHVDVG